MCFAALTDDNGGMDEVTKILQAIDNGEPRAAEQLLPLVYDELRRVAASRMALEKPGQTLPPTALVHEAYLRLAGPDPHRHWKSRGEFFAAAAEAMRRILIENARKKRTLKRGGNRQRLHVDVQNFPSAQSPDDIMDLDEALEKFQQIEPDVARLVKLRFFAGLTSNEAASALGVSERTADAWWAYAKVWLLAELRAEDEK